jgi:Carbonic anhydrase
LTSNETAGDGEPRSSNRSTPPEALMSNLRPLLERNRAFAAAGAHAGPAIMPRQQVFLVTCLDPRVDPAAFLGVELGDAPVIRNAGGRVTETVINDIAFISYLARTMIPDGPLFEVAVVHHTGCGPRLRSVTSGTLLLVRTITDRRLCRRRNNADSERFGLPI